MTFGEFAGAGRDARPFAAYLSGPMGQNRTPPGVARRRRGIGKILINRCQQARIHSPGRAKLFRDVVAEITRYPK